MTDSFGRTIDYLRISVTDRCNLRCVYCMPESGVEWIPHAEILSFEEMLRVCRILAGQGIRKAKVTGGEPLVRKGAVDFIRRLKATKGIEQVTMTSNGVLLGDYLDALLDAGLDALNVSLDTLEPDTFFRITGGYGVQEVLASIERAAAQGLPVKVNCVPVAGKNSAEFVRIASLAADKDIQVRFIELMPIGFGREFKPVPSGEIVAALEREYGTLKPFSGRLGNGPAHYYTIEGFAGKIGFIDAVSHKFCNHCNRLRLTSDGRLKACLAHDAGLDVKKLMREGASDAEIEKAALELIGQKPEGHHFVEEQGQTAGNRDKMFRIGG